MQNEDGEVTDGASDTKVEEPEAGIVDGAALADDASRSPEEESQSQIDGDPRDPNEMQPPTEVGY